MTLAVAIILGLIGLVAAAIGLGYYTVFRLALMGFDRSLKTEVAQYGRDQVEAAAMKITNPMVRRIVSQHLVAAGGTAATTIVRGALTSRMRTAVYLTLAGLAALIASFFTSAWLPLIMEGRVGRL
jgi:hypothetical protein